MLTLSIGFVGRRFHKSYCQMYHAILTDIVKPILQNGGHVLSNIKRKKVDCYLPPLNVFGGIWRSFGGAA